MGQRAPQEFYYEIVNFIILRFKLVFLPNFCFLCTDFLRLLRRIKCTFFHNIALCHLLNRITFANRGHHKADDAYCSLYTGRLSFVYMISLKFNSNFMMVFRFIQPVNSIDLLPCKNKILGSVIAIVA
jgi:hypothetical protein